MIVRFGVVALLFIILLALVLRKLAAGNYGMRFRIVSALLLLALFLLGGLGIYSSMRREAAPSPQIEFARNRDMILEQMRELLEREEYAAAVELGERYGEIQDQQLDRLLDRGREGYLLQKISRHRDDPKVVVEAYQELVGIRPSQEYRRKLDEWKEVLREETVHRIEAALEDVPESAPGMRMLGYRMLTVLDPGGQSYALAYERYRQLLEERLDSSKWTSLCSAMDLSYCRHVGFQARVLSPGGSRAEEGGEVLGVVFRPRGTVVDARGNTAPEDAYYYILFTSEGSRLAPVDNAAVQGFPVQLPEALSTRGAGAGLQGSRDTESGPS